MRRKTGFRKGAGFFTLTAVLFLSSLPVLPVRAADRLQDVGDKLVVVIDPGHGGENFGTIENGHEEKYMTMITARAMYEELSLYDDVEVHLTRTGDVAEDISLEDRAAFAASVDADFLFSIHYNASGNHELFGSEVWVSTLAPFNCYGYQFGNELLRDISEMGLLIRGVKTRSDEDDANFYGIIRHSWELGVPAVIIEHCHVDEERDAIYCATDEQLKAFGRMDATAVAKYFGLKSSVLGVDYSDYSLTEATDTAPVPVTVQDLTRPDICQTELLETDYGTGQLSLRVTAADYDSCLLYYSYSIDGGLTYSRREPWPGCDTLTGSYYDTFVLNLQIPSGVVPTVILRAYNMYDLYTESEPYISPEMYLYAGSEEMGEAQAVDTEGTSDSEERGQDDDVQEPEEDKEQEVSFLTFLAICLVIVAMILTVLIISVTIESRKRRRRRRQRRKVSGDSRNHPR